MHLDNSKQEREQVGPKFWDEHFKIYSCLQDFTGTDAAGCCSDAEWMSDKGLSLWLPSQQDLIMKSFQMINCFCKEQERLM